MALGSECPALGGSAVVFALISSSVIDSLLHKASAWSWVGRCQTGLALLGDSTESELPLV
jgi:hypothetical protein